MSLYTFPTNGRTGDIADYIELATTTYRLCSCACNSKYG